MSTISFARRISFAEYIKDALEGFVSQKTNFNYEVLIHDDASTDNTADIIREYERKYLELIKPIYQKENQYSKGVNITSTFHLPRLKGRYVALCEGDDYWTDSGKLQRQFDAMEAHPELDICAHKRYITGMCVDGETLLLPDIKKPYIPRKRFDGSLDYYKALLRTIRREQFIDEHILGISKEKYSAYIEELEGAGYIKKVEPDAGISGYILTTKGNDELTKKGEISFVKELNIQPQIGLINIQNSVSGSVF